MVLSLLPDRSTEREREAREGGGSPRGSCTRKRGVLLKNTKFQGWRRLEGATVWIFLGGDGLQALHISVFKLKPH